MTTNLPYNTRWKYFSVGPPKIPKLPQDVLSICSFTVTCWYVYSILSKSSLLPTIHMDKTSLSSTTISKATLVVIQILFLQQTFSAYHGNFHIYTKEAVVIPG